MTDCDLQDVAYVTLSGEQVVENHFQVFFDPLCSALLIKNSNIDCVESCGLYRLLHKEEEYVLNPDDAFRIGTLEFAVQRFNVGYLSDIGQRSAMEDSY